MTAAKLTALQQAFHVIRDLEAKVASLTSLTSLTAEPIAILGTACRLPGGVTTPEELWQLLASARDATGEIPAERFDVDAFYDPDPRAIDKTLTRRAGMLDEIDRFDARFFGISPREAMAMDPQQRLLLECTWEALERAGVAPHRLAGTATGVFVAAGPSDYLHRHAYGGGPKEMEVYDGTGNAGCFAAGRIAYLLGAQGPCFTVDTACSSSLLAFHLACQSLRAGECELAIVAGVNLIISPETFLFLSRAGNISADGRSRTFDAGASGYGRGEGCGVVVLQRHSRARSDGHPILALARASAVNHDGASSGLTVPSGLAQQAVIRRACEAAAISPRALGYVEAHGTATLLGDPIELEALGEVAAGRAPDEPLWVGSIKSNLGHLEAAAGIAGLLKVVLMLQHRQIPASLHFHQPNPHADWASLPLRVPTALMPWPSSGPRLAGLSSFGLSGTNVHVVLEEVPPLDGAETPLPGGPPIASSAEPRLLLLSARTPQALRELAARYRRLLTSQPALSIDELAHTAALRRSHHEHRLAVAGATRARWLEALEAYAAETAHPGALLGTVPAEAPPLAFVISGQGSQWLGMGRELCASSAVFRDALREATDALVAHGAPSLLTAFGPQGEDHLSHDLSHGEVVQPLLFAIQIALARQWRAWGVEPAAVTGHSVGEAAAAHLAGALSLDEAARVVAVRSRLLARVRHHGGMLLVELPADELAPHLARHQPHLEIGARNAPRATVVSGQLAALEALQQELTEAKVFARRVKIDVASHSPQVEPLLDELRAELAGLRPTATRIPLISTVTGEAQDGRTLDATYWARNLRQPVRFAEALASLDATGVRTYLELSPHPVLAIAMEQTLGGERRGVRHTRARSMGWPEA
jgi:acyl transferase domain-containing protein